MKKYKFWGLAILLLSFMMIVSACGGAAGAGTSSNASKSSSKSSSKTSTGSNSISKPSTKSGVTNVVFWNLFGGADGTTMNAIVKKFNDTHPTIHIQAITQDWGQYYTKLTAAVLGGKAPDLGISHVDHLGTLVTQGVIQPLGPEAKAAGIDWNEFFQAPMKDAVIGGKHYAVPLDIHTLLLFYNKSLLKKSGVTDQDVQNIKSYSDFVKVLDKVKQQNIIPMSFPEGGWFPLALWETFYMQMGGGPLMNANHTKVLFDQGANKQISINAMQDVWNLYNKDKVIPKNISNIEQLFKSGKAAFCLDGTWNVDDFHKTLGSNLGVAEMPLFFKKKAAWANSHTFILPTNPKRTAAQTKDAMIFVKWVEDNAWMWAKAGHIPANKSVQSTSQYKQIPFRSNYGSQASFVSYFPMTNKIWMMSDNKVLNILQGILLKKTSVDKGMQDIGSTLTRQLG